MYWQRCYECDELFKLLPSFWAYFPWDQLVEKTESYQCYIGWDSSQKNRALLVVVFALEYRRSQIIYEADGDEGEREDGMVALRGLWRDVIAARFPPPEPVR